MATTKLRKRKASNTHYNLEFDPIPMDRIQKEGKEYIKAMEFTTGTIFSGRAIPSRISCFYNIKEQAITWKYNRGKEEEVCNGNTDYCYLVRDDNFCPSGYYLCLPHNHIVDWRYNATDNYFLSPQEFEDDNKMTMKEYGKIQEKDHITSYKNMKNRFATEVA